MIEDWEKDPDNFDRGLYAYLNRISLLTRSDGEEETETDAHARGKVNLMTIHASKGLEFPVVFIAGAEEGIIPHERSLEESEDALEEERRLFYVAITRARDKLYITSCRKRTTARSHKQQDESERLPSPFLGEIPPNLIENGNDETNSGENEKSLLECYNEQFGGK